MPSSWRPRGPYSRSRSPARHVIRGPEHMELTPLPFRATLQQYREQAAALLEAWRGGDASAIRVVRHTHPRFLNPAIPWLPKRLSDAEVRSGAFDLSDAELTVARAYDFPNWARLADHVAA